MLPGNIHMRDKAINGNILHRIKYSGVFRTPTSIKDRQLYFNNTAQKMNMTKSVNMNKYDQIRMENVIFLAE